MLIKYTLMIFSINEDISGGLYTTHYYSLTPHYYRLQITCIFYMNTHTQTHLYIIYSIYLSYWVSTCTLNCIFTQGHNTSRYGQWLGRAAVWIPSFVIKVFCLGTLPDEIWEWGKKDVDKKNDEKKTMCWCYIDTSNCECC